MERKKSNLFSSQSHPPLLDFATEYGTKTHGLKPVFIFLIMLLMATVNLKAGDPIKIMPVGNSITAGEHYGKPATAERTGYRKYLYEMLIDSGYNVDFVGTQKHGQRPDCDTNWYDWNCEAYPGSQIPYIGRQTSKALKIYNPDILLVHVGTNGDNWNNKPGEVMVMLDSINNYSVDNDHPMTVFLCKIINRYYTEDPAPTTQFNEKVADTVATRTGDKIKIILVDMENGIGLDYSDSLPDPTAIPPYEGGDFWGYTYPGITYDKYHPNDKGNAKMAVKFYEELVKEFEEPDSIKDNKVVDIKLVAIGINDSIKISWEDNLLYEDGYIIERKLLAGSEYSLVDTTNANITFIVDSSANLTIDYRYRLKAYNATGASPWSAESYIHPAAVNETNSIPRILKVYPNPIKDEVNFEFNVHARTNVDIKIVDINGAVIGNITNQVYDPGLHTITWNLVEGSNRTLQSGVYFCKITIGNNVLVQKLILFI